MLNNNFGSFGTFGRYGLDDKWNKLQNDIAENMKDPFMINEFLQNVREAWGRYWKFRDEYDRDVTALMEVDSLWRDNSISLNTGHTVYGDDAKAIILRMRSGKITPREDFVKFALDAKDIVSTAKNFKNLLSAKNLKELMGSLEELIGITTFLEDAIDELVKDNSRLIERLLFEEGEAADKAEAYLKEYGGFTFRYNVGRLGFSIDISTPPFAIPHSITLPSYDKPSSSNKTTTHNSIIPPYEPLPYTIYVVKPDDSFWKIASEQMGSGAKYEELARYNGLTSSNLIHPGNVLKIPR